MPATTASLNQSASPRSWLYPRDPEPRRLPAPQFQTLSAVTAVEVFEIGRDALFMPLLQIGFWFGSQHLEVMVDVDGEPFQYSTLADALLTLRRLGWTGDVECTQMPY